MSEERKPAPAEPRPDIVAGARVLPLVPRNIDEVLRYAKMVMVAGAVPDSLAKEGNRQLPENEIIARVVSVISAGSEVGMGPMAAMANIALINKRRYIWGQGAIAVLQNSGQLEDMRQEKIGPVPSNSATTAQFHDDFGIRVILQRKGRPTPYVGEYTVGRAKRAHLWMNTSKRPWIEHPERQLFWRAFHLAAVEGFSDCLSGLGIRETADDLLLAPSRITDTSFLDDARASALAQPEVAEQPHPVHDAPDRPPVVQSDQPAESSPGGVPEEDAFGLPPLPDPGAGASPESRPEEHPVPDAPPGGEPAAAPAPEEPKRQRRRTWPRVQRLPAVPGSAAAADWDWEGYADAMLEAIAECDDIQSLRLVRKSNPLSWLRSADRKRWTAVNEALDAREAILKGDDSAR